MIWGDPTFTPLFFNEHTCVLRMLGGCCLAVINSGFFFLLSSLILVQQGYKATPLWAARVPLHMGGSIPHQECRHLLISLPDMDGYLPITAPKFGLANHDPVP